MTKNKQCTLLISTLGGGGAEGVCITLANGLSNKGWNVDLVVLNLSDSVNLQKISNEVNLINLNVAKARESFVSLKKYLCHKAPDKILVFNYELTIILVVLRLLYRFSFKLIARNINTFSQNVLQEPSSIKDLILKFSLLLLYKKADFVINQSYGMQTDLLSYFPSFTDRCRVIHNPIAQIFEDFPTDVLCATKISPRYILCVGRLETQKAFHEAVAAFASVQGKFPDLRLKFVGKGSLETALKLQVKSLGLESKVDFLGYQGDMVRHYKNASLTLLTSLYEGFPNVLVESISVGTPVVSLDCQSGPSEIIKSGVNGVLVSSKEFLADAIFEVLTNPRYNDTVAIKKTAHVYSRIEILGQYEDVLDMIC